jgi:ribosomal protein L37AE/L43A
MKFVANLAGPFNAETDPSRPALGSIIRKGGKRWKIEKVEAVTVGSPHLTAMIAGTFTPAPYDNMLTKHHPTRTFSCPKCGKPIVHTNKFGMFCEDRCTLKEAKKAYLEMERLVQRYAREWRKAERCRKG